MPCNYDPSIDRDIQRRVQKLEQVVGVGEFPANLPVLTREGTERITNIPELIVWVTENLEEVAGKFPNEFEITENGQKRKVKLEDISDGLEKIFKKKTGDAIAAVPDWWQARIGGDRPQLSVVYAGLEDDGSIGKSRWTVNIPHWGGKYESFPEAWEEFPDYVKGSIFGMTTLVDNSKIIINAKDFDEAEETLQKLIDTVSAGAKLDPQPIHLGKRKGQALKQIKVTAVQASYYSKGQFDLNPDWIVHRNEK